MERLKRGYWGMEGSKVTLLGMGGRVKVRVLVDVGGVKVMVLGMVVEG